MIWERLHPLPLVGLRVGELPEDTSLADAATHSKAYEARETSELQRLKAARGDETAIRFATRWDMYHRENIKLSRAKAASKMAEDMFETARNMDHEFHLGEGRLV